MRALSLLLFCCWFIPTYSNFQSLSQQSSLSDLSYVVVNDIAQDSYGQMWFATLGGLMRYNGYSSKYYNSLSDDPLSLPGDQCKSLFIDSRDNLWIITTAGICRYDDSKDYFNPYFFDGQDNFNQNIQIHENNNLLICSVKGRLFYLEIDSIHFTNTFKKLAVFNLKGNPINVLLSVMNIEDDKLWVYNTKKESSGLTYSNIFAGKLKFDESVEFRTMEEYILKGEITTCAIHNKNEFFVGTRAGLFSFDRNLGAYNKIESTEDLYILDLLFSTDKKLWIGTNKAGIAHMDLQTGEFSWIEKELIQRNPRYSKRILSIYEDFSANLWISYGGGGINVINLKQKPFRTYRHDPKNSYSLSSSTVLCFNETRDEMLIGTNYDGLVIMKYDHSLDDYIFENLPMPDYIIKDPERYEVVWRIEKETDSLFWLGTNFGLIKAIKEAKKWKFEQVLTKDQVGVVKAIFIDNNKNLWFGSKAGLFLIPVKKRNTSEYFHYSKLESEPGYAADISVSDFLLDKSGNFWIGTNNRGIQRLSSNYNELDLSGRYKPELKFIEYKASNKAGSSINNNSINAFFEHFDGTIWIGTSGGGINILDPATSTFRYLTGKDGLAGEKVLSLLPDGNGNLWISTNRGLSCYNLYENYFLNYTHRDGLQGDMFIENANFRASNGQLFFGGRNGLSGFYPSEVKNNTIPPKIMLNGLKIFNEEVKVDQEFNRRIILPGSLNELSSITLSHKEYVFSIGFSVIHYENTDENTAEYLLEGFDKDWNIIPASNEYISYNNLPHGRYILKLRGRSGDDILSEETKELQINVLPPWWKTWWAKTVLVLVILASGAGLMALFLHRKSLKHLLMLEKMERHKMEEINEEKLQFFTNISHELRTPLSLTVAPIDEILFRSDYSENFVRKQLKLANRNAKLLFRLIDQIIDFRRLNAGKLNLTLQKTNINALVKEVIQNFEIVRSEKDIRMTFNYIEEPYYLWIDPHKIEQALYNLLSNAFKFTPGSGDIIISLKESIEQIHSEEPELCVKLTVYNDGKEIPEEHLTRIFERFYKIDHTIQGSGIGLAYTKSLIELHKGRIFAESVFGRGVVFSVLLPLKESRLNEESLNNQLIYQNDILWTGKKEEYADNTEKYENGLSILIIEDNDDLRDFLTSHYATEYNILEASNGIAGLKIAEDSIPDVIISDILMPEMDGVELCRKLKEDSRTCHIPVILLTAKDSMDYRISGFDSGADAYVIKPFEINVLDKQIHGLIKNRELIREYYRKRNFMIDISAKTTSMDDRFLAQVESIIHGNLSDPDFGVNNLSQLLFLGTTQVYRKLKALTGYTPVELIRVIRLVKAAEMLKTEGLSVKEVGYRTGFKSPSYFIKCFREHFNMTPSVFLGESSLN